MNKIERSHLAQFRFGILPLRMETGRYVGEKPEDRLCKLCDQQSVESETHFLFYCSLYNNIRSDIFGELFNSDEFKSMDFPTKMVHLMEEHTRKLSKYIVRAYNCRRSCLYK